MFKHGPFFKNLYFRLMGKHLGNPNVHEIFSFEITHRRMKKILWESEAVPPVKKDFAL